MPGTKRGGLKCAVTNKLKYGSDYYQRIGKQGGSKSRTGGFYKNSAAARVAGKKGGKIAWDKYYQQQAAKYIGPMVLFCYAANSPKRNPRGRSLGGSSRKNQIRKVVKVPTGALH